jgi:hypothetical protein
MSGRRHGTPMQRTAITSPATSHAQAFAFAPIHGQMVEARSHTVRRRRRPLETRRAPRPGRDRDTTARTLASMFQAATTKLLCNWLPGCQTSRPGWHPLIRGQSRTPELGHVPHRLQSVRRRSCMHPRPRRRDWRRRPVLPRLPLPAQGRPRRTPDPAGHHPPTVKPLALVRWLVRLTTPPSGVVLGPFARTGPRCTPASWKACTGSASNATSPTRRCAPSACGPPPKPPCQQDHPPRTTAMEKPHEQPPYA